jgi:hypothetical protein
LNVSNDRFRGLIQSRFPGADASTLFDAWQAASMIYPLTTGFHWGRFDFQWYIEGCMSRQGPAQTESGFHDVNRFITLRTHPNTGYVTIPNYVQAMIDGKEIDGAGPLDISRQLHQNSDKALRLLAGLYAESETELAKTLYDIKTMAFLDANDTLVVYSDVPGLTPSEMYTIRVRSAATNNLWAGFLQGYQSVFL